MNAALNYIEKETGLAAGINYQFSFGTKVPSFLKLGGGLYSSSMVAGYKVVKGDREIVIDTDNPSEEIKQIINFLKDETH
jgi:hypothetical protein